ncbi:MAG: penicillin-binding protein 2 [Verrucomicrobiota bacterium]|nr:penicillin-binding protein 2 [Verrucomicrobiota bacterium]
MARKRQRGPRIELRIHMLALLILCGIGAIVARLWWVQVSRGEVYRSRIAGRSQVTVRIPSIRGEIRDRNGIALAQNRASYEVDFYLRDMVRGYKARAREQGQAVPLNPYIGTVKGMKQNMQEADIVRIVNTAVVPRLQDLDLAKDYSAQSLQRHYRNDTEVPFTYLEDIDFPTIAKFSEHDVGLPGVDISIKPVREYLYGSLAAHLLGYVGAQGDIDRVEAAKYTFYQADVEGKSQVELYMDKYLRGTPGVRVMQRNVKGVIDAELRTEPPKPGNNVYLTIDARIQFIAEQALRAVGRGAAVVVNPNNGDILAMASVPSYDPNKFIPSISAKDWKELRDDETDPLTNRAISAYAPGSTYKTVTALAGLHKGLTGGTTFTCTGGVTYGNKYMKCWVTDRHMPPHGTLTLTDAIKYSCNAFFYQWGNAAGIPQIDMIGDALCLGQKTGIELSGESPGILPGPEWLQTISPNDRWSSGHTANVSIGQGYVLATPLQMAMVAATLANRGISYQPRLIDRVLDQQGEPVLDGNGNPAVPPTARVRTNLHDMGISEQQVELVRRGMWKVVNDEGGTAKIARLPGVEVAGKTGTAQFWRGNKKDNHTWFISFAPYDKPKYAVCVFVQGAKAGGLVSAPIAARILQQSLAMENGEVPQLAALAPAKGSFQFIEQVKFDNAGGPAVTGSDLETAEHTEMADKKLAAQGKQVSAEPDIKPDADAQGRVIPRAQAVRPAQDRRSIFQKFFRPDRKPAQPAQQPTAPPRRFRWPF